MRCSSGGPDDTTKYSGLSSTTYLRKTPFLALLIRRAFIEHAHVARFYRISDLLRKATAIPRLQSDLKTLQGPTCDLLPKDQLFLVVNKDFQFIPLGQSQIFFGF
jgi:hypothetical protein